MRSKRGVVVVTGIGAVTTYGWGLDALRAGLRSGKTGLTGQTHLKECGHRTNVAGMVPDGPGDLPNIHKAWDRMSKADQFALEAAREAIDQAQIDPQRESCGLFFGSSTAGMLECEDYLARAWGTRGDRAHLRLLASQQLNGPGDAVARRFGVSGPVLTNSTACASGAIAIGSALESIRSGEIDSAIVGGADSICNLTYGGFNSLRLVDENPCRPFSRDRDGMNLGEGAGVLVLETLERSRQRGSEPLAIVLGYGASCDAYHMTAPHPEGHGALAAMQRALRDADIPIQEISMVNTHGTGTPQNDAAEAKACADLFGDRLQNVVLTSSKASVGHLLGASGAIEAVATILDLRDRVVHPTANTAAPEPDFSINLVVGENAALGPHRVAISNSFGFGGSNSAIILQAWEGANE